jgi:hypothetical protein
MLCESLVGSKMFDQARTIADALFSGNQSSVEVLTIRGICLYYTGNIPLALKHFKQVLQNDPGQSDSACACACVCMGMTYNIYVYMLCPSPLQTTAKPERHTR